MAAIDPSPCQSKDWIVSSTFGNCESVGDYRKINRIGEGTYGYVYRASHRSTNEIVALKRIILHHESREGFPLTSIREIKTLKRCRHPNIVQLLDVVVGPKRDAVFLLFEYCEHDLAIIKENIKRPFTESEIKCLGLQLLSAVEYIHKNWIVHRDIKLSNLLYNNKGQLKLADFGLARTIAYPATLDLTPVVVTLWYRAPEILLGSTDYSFSIDIWSTACIIGELLTGQPLFSGLSEIEQIFAIFNVLGSPNARIWENVANLQLIKSGTILLDREQRRYPYNNLKEKVVSIGTGGLELLNAMLTYDPCLRITARDALRHEYFFNSPYPIEEDLMPTFASFHDKLSNSETHHQ